MSERYEDLEVLVDEIRSARIAGHSMDVVDIKNLLRAIDALLVERANGPCNQPGHLILHRVKPCAGIAPQDNEACALKEGHEGPHSHVGEFRNKRISYCVLCVESERIVAAARADGLGDALNEISIHDNLLLHDFEAAKKHNLVEILTERYNAALAEAARLAKGERE